TVSLLAGSFGGINLEDIAAPRCFEIERKLKEVCDIPVFHDDQHGTAVVVAAAMLNALKVVGKQKGSVRIVINGAGSAGIAIARLLLQMKMGEIVLCDINGAIYEGAEGLNPAQAEMAALTNPQHRQGTLADVLKGADVFVGVSRADLVSPEMVQSMAPGAILFPMANPKPEIMPDLALQAGAAVVGTGRSDFANQINNVLVFPGVFRGALDVRASDINDEMKVAAAYAIAELVSDEERSAEYVIPAAFDPRVGAAVAAAVGKAARETGVARI
ncbi:MAG: NAD-dependent malic enzyme, partial [Clostridia bacterium]|nr:NAD-dependent malic enzyme [Clostridia bacterium]